MDLQNEILIAVMGATGTGKSTFINLVSGSTLGVGNDLKSCTSSVAYSQPFELAGRNVTLMDTPGFDDTTVSDTDILKIIALHLSNTYEMGIKLSGVIYLHRITDNRMGGIALRNFSMFRELCGEKTLKNVVIVTTMWGLVDPMLGDAREKQLQTDKKLFKPVLDKGALMMRHDNTVVSGARILQSIISNHPMALQVQHELVDEGKDISQTGAGVELNRELAAMTKKHEEDLKQVRKEMEEALAKKDEEMREELEEQRQELEARLRKIDEDRERLSREYAEEKKRADEEMRKIRAILEDERKAREAANQQLERLNHELLGMSKRSSEQQQHLMSQIINATKPRKRRRGLFSFVGGAIDSILGI